MAFQISAEDQAFHDDLVKKSNEVKKMALELMKEHLAPNPPPDSTEAEQLAARVAKIRLIPPEKRSATEFLELLNAIYKHAESCVNFACEYNQACWRMRGLYYQMHRLKNKDHANFLTLWNRHVVLEMHTETCKMKDKCYCSNVEHYRCFLRSSLNLFNLMEERMVGLEMEMKDIRATLRLFVTPITSFFEDQIKFPENPSEVNPKRKSARLLIYEIRNGMMHGFAENKIAMKSLLKKPDIPLTNVVPEKPKPKPAAAAGHACGAGCRHEASAVCQCELEIDPALPGTSSGVQLGKEVAPVVNTVQDDESDEEECDHSPEMVCDCMVDDTPVDVKIGQREPITRIRSCRGSTTDDERKSAISIICGRLREISKDAERPLLIRPRVATISCYIRGTKWRAVYCVDVHNVFDESTLNEVIVKYMFACRYLNVSMVIFNFLGHEHSEGSKRISQLLSVGTDVGGVATNNLQYTPRKNELNIWVHERKLLLLHGHKDKPFWYAGCSVRVINKKVEQTWKNTLRQDAIFFSNIVDRYGNTEMTAESSTKEVKAEEGLKMKTGKSKGTPAERVVAAVADRTPAEDAARAAEARVKAVYENTMKNQSVARRETSSGVTPSVIRASTSAGSSKTPSAPKQFPNQLELKTSMRVAEEFADSLNEDIAAQIAGERKAMLPSSSTSEQQKLKLEKEVMRRLDLFTETAQEVLRKPKQEVELQGWKLQQQQQEQKINELKARAAELTKRTSEGLSMIGVDELLQEINAQGEDADRMRSAMLKSIEEQEAVLATTRMEKERMDETWMGQYIRSFTAERIQRVEQLRQRQKDQQELDKQLMSQGVEANERQGQVMLPSSSKSEPEPLELQGQDEKDEVQQMQGRTKAEVYEMLLVNAEKLQTLAEEREKAGIEGPLIPEKDQPEFRKKMEAMGKVLEKFEELNKLNQDSKKRGTEERPKEEKELEELENKKKVEVILQMMAKAEEFKMLTNEGSLTAEERHVRLQDAKMVAEDSERAQQQLERELEMERAALATVKMERERMDYEQMRRRLDAIKAEKKGREEKEQQEMEDKRREQLLRQDEEANERQAIIRMMSEARLDESTVPPEIARRLATRSGKPTKTIRSSKGDLHGTIKLTMNLTGPSGSSSTAQEEWAEKLETIKQSKPVPAPVIPPWSSHSSDSTDSLEAILNDPNPDPTKVWGTRTGGPPLPTSERKKKSTKKRNKKK